MFQIFSRRPGATLITPRGKPLLALASLKLASGGEEDAAALPGGVSVESRIHAHCASALDSTEAVWATVEEACTCAKAGTGGALEYRWRAGVEFVQLPMAVFVSRTLAASRAALADTAVFPAGEGGGPFPAAFLPAAKKLWSRLLRVHLHALLEHRACAGDALVRGAFVHFYVFGKMHGLFAAEELPAVIAARVAAACATAPTS